MRWSSQRGDLFSTSRRLSRLALSNGDLFEAPSTNGSGWTLRLACSFVEREAGCAFHWLQGPIHSRFSYVSLSEGFVGSALPKAHSGVGIGANGQESASNPLDQGDSPCSRGQCSQDRSPSPPGSHVSTSYNEHWAFQALVGLALGQASFRFDLQFLLPIPQSLPGLIERPPRV